MGARVWTFEAGAAKQKLAKPGQGKSAEELVKHEVKEEAVKPEVKDEEPGQQSAVLGPVKSEENVAAKEVKSEPGSHGGAGKKKAVRRSKRGL